MFVVSALGGLYSESMAFGLDSPLRWVPDFVVGMVFIAAGIGSWSRARGVAALLVATGFLWFLANVESSAVYWHRAALVHLLLSYPSWRPRSPVSLGLVLLGYVAVVAPVWRSDAGIIAASCVLVAALVRERANSAGRLRHHATVALQAGVAVCAALVAGSLARFTLPASDAVVGALLVYQGALIGAPIRLYTGARREVTPAITDLVVELGESRAGSLRDALSRTLGDPFLQVGYVQTGTDVYLGDDGVPVPLPSNRDPRAATFVARDGRPFAVLVHDRAILTDPALMTAVEAATRLSAANATLNADLREQVEASIASRRRLLLTADDERRRLEERLHAGVERRLGRLRETVRALGSRPTGAASQHLRSAGHLLDQIVDELHSLASGLHPRELDAGLASALDAMARRNVVPVQVSAPDERYPPEIEVAGYYACAEALANVTKHAAASSATIEVTDRDRRLFIVICDDGVGGTDPSLGTGLKGVADRIQALGGSLTVDSPPSAGTRLTLELPLD